MGTVCEGYAAACLSALGVYVVGEVRNLGLGRADDLLGGQFAAQRVSFGDGAEGGVGFLDAAPAFGAFGRPAPGGERLRTQDAAVDRRGLSQAVLAGLVGRSESWLSRVEREKRRVDSHEVHTVSPCAWTAPSSRSWRCDPRSHSCGEPSGWGLPVNAPQAGQ
ncbi:MAG TPA: helix-turn-helix transcriptional regulator [Trebonia sp.]|nr:helix-turn-helix transcriptional regulator [Trebonia sp.]